MEDASDRLRAFCSITFDDCFVVRDLKVIEGSSGPFVAMPSRKLTVHCPQCRCKNHLRAAYCNQCGLRLKDDVAGKDQEGRTKLYADIAHPINSECREMIQKRVVEEFQVEVRRAELPGYRSRYDDYFGEEGIAEPANQDETPKTPTDGEKTDQPAEPPSAPSSLKERKVEPGKEEPRAPHKPSRQPTERPQGGKASGEFGAGIL